MKGFSFLKSPWFMALSLHISLVLFLLGWPAFYSEQSLPKNHAVITAYLSASLSSQISVKVPAHAMPDQSNQTTGFKSNANALAVRQVQAQVMAPKNIQVLLKAIAEEIQQHVVYPDLAQSQMQQGSSTINFTLSPNGAISQIVLTRSSGVIELDQAAIAAVKASSPIVMPIQLKSRIELSLPVEFSLN